MLKDKIYQISEGISGLNSGGSVPQRPRDYREGGMVRQGDREEEDYNPKEKQPYGGIGTGWGRELFLNNPADPLGNQLGKWLGMNSGGSVPRFGQSGDPGSATMAPTGLGNASSRGGPSYPGMNAGLGNSISALSSRFNSRPNAYSSPPPVAGSEYPAPGGGEGSIESRRVNLDRADHFSHPRPRPVHIKRETRIKPSWTPDDKYRRWSHPGGTYSQRIPEYYPGSRPVWSKYSTIPAHRIVPDSFLSSRGGPSHPGMNAGLGDSISQFLLGFSEGGLVTQGTSPGGGDYASMADVVAGKGRYGDSTLIHVNPREVQGLEQQYPGMITTNPHTGYPEAFALAALLPLIAGGATAAVPVAAATTAATLTAAQIAAAAAASAASAAAAAAAAAPVVAAAAAPVAATALAPALGGGALGGGGGALGGGLGATGGGGGALGGGVTGGLAPGAGVLAPEFGGLATTAAPTSLAPGAGVLAPEAGGLTTAADLTAAGLPQTVQATQAAAIPDTLLSGLEKVATPIGPDSLASTGTNLGEFGFGPNPPSGPSLFETPTLDISAAEVTGGVGKDLAFDSLGESLAEKSAAEAAKGLVEAEGGFFSNLTSGQMVGGGLLASQAIDAIIRATEKEEKEPWKSAKSSYDGPSSWDGRTYTGGGTRGSGSGERSFYSSGRVG